MSRFRFVHAADLHLDSPFRFDAGAHAASFADATFRAFTRVVDLCLREQARFLVLAGDLFDAKDRSVKARLVLRRELARLDAAGIETFIVHGNHDPLSDGVGAIALPPSVHVFGAQWAEREVRADGALLCRVQGASYPRPDVSENLALRYHRVGPGFTVGLLHANVGGQAGHANYAPCSSEDLAAAGLDYWALGHVHTRRQWEAGSALAVYPGNPQGRHPLEAGPRGCVVVEVEQGQARTRFVPLEVLRWVQLEVPVDGERDLAGLLSGCEQAVLASCEGAPEAWAVRVTLSGRSALHRELGPGGLRAFEDELRRALAGAERPVLLESVRGQTQAALDLEAIRTLGGLPAQVLAQAGGGAEGFLRLVDEVEELSRLELQLKKLQLPSLASSGARLLERAVARAAELLAEEG